MKTNILRISTLISLLLFTCSCNCDFSMLTSVDENGGITRTITCPASKELLCGKWNNNEVVNGNTSPVKPGEEWNTEWMIKGSNEKMPWPVSEPQYDSLCKAMNLKTLKDTAIVMMSRRFDSVQEMNDKFHFDIIPMKTEANFKKSFRWFYTEYSFSETFTKRNFLIPASRYLTEDELTFWCTGENVISENLSGSELFDSLCDIAEKARRWLTANCFEEYCQHLISHYDSIENASISKEEFIASKDDFVTKGATSVEESLFDEMHEIFRKALVEYYGTGFNAGAFIDCLPEEFELDSEILAAFQNFSFAYAVKLPGTDIADVQPAKLNLGMCYSKDYSVSYSSRKINAWAWGLTALLIIILYIWTDNLKKRQNR